MKKSLGLSSFLLFIFAILATYGMVVGGHLVDGVVSKWFSDELDMSVSCHNAKVVRWSKIYFDSITLGTAAENPWVISGDGSLIFKNFPYGRSDDQRIDLSFHRLSLFAPAIEKLSVGTFSLSNFLESPLLIDELSVSFLKKGSIRAVH